MKFIVNQSIKNVFKLKSQIRSMSQPNDLDEIGLKTKGKKSKGILYYFQPWKWKKKAVVEVESDVKQKQRRNSGKSSLT